VEKTSVEGGVEYLLSEEGMGYVGSGGGYLRVIVSGGLCEEMLRWFKGGGAGRWRGRPPPIFIYHGRGEERRRQVMEAIRVSGMSNVRASHEPREVVEFGRMEG
jgi:hypothetical protein